MSNHSNQPKTFGERFKDEGLTGILKNKNKDAKSNPNEMHFLEHLEELRWVIFKAVLAFLLGCVGVAIFMQDSVKLLQMPLISAVEDFGVIDIDLQTIGLDQYIEPLDTQEVDLGMLRNAKEDSLIAWGIDDPHHRTRILTHFASGHNRNLLQVIRSYSPIFIAMKICFLGGIGISLPLILYFVGSFVVPGLTKDEKKVFFPGCVAATLLFIAGASMTYFFILPYSLAFTIEFSFNVLGLDVYRPEAGNYYSTIIWMTFAVGIAFQFPLVLILLIKIGILNVTKLRENRRLVLVILMVSAALITPGGDPVSLCILTVPLYILYELAIITGSIIEVRKRRTEWNEWDESIQGPKPEKPPSREKGRWILYISIIIIIGSLSIFAFQNKKLIEPWIESFRKFGQFSDSEKPKATKSLPLDLSKQEKKESQLTSFPKKEFTLQLSPVDLN
ncbi:twin-arginine translocase subunit TatC, partial [Opitutales bacterium]|nr:twin-arginine translocase subunit TatC [Opitutales bacterium]